MIDNDMEDPEDGLDDLLDEDDREKQDAFDERLRKQLGEAKVKLLAVHIATGRIWVLSVRLPEGSLMTLHAPVAQGCDLLSDETCDDIARRVIVRLRSRGLAA